MEDESFSRRHGYTGTPAEISVREAAPDDFRFALLEEARAVGKSPAELRETVCSVLKKRPDPSNWSEFPNIWNEVQDLVYGCEWFRVYDIVEAVCVSMDRYDRRRFSDALNEFMIENGIGWQIESSRVVARGSEAFESSVHIAIRELTGAGRTTASSEIEEALRDLSRRPTPDLTGAVQHGMGALECVARDVAGDPKATLGDVIKRYPMIPKPLDKAVENVWGYASQYGRHIAEGRIPTRDDAEFVVGLAAVVATYLSRGGN